MKDQRVDYFRKLLESLVESLEADVRVGRWVGPETVPEPLQKSAGKLMERLTAANRLASDRFVGSPAVVSALTAMSEAARKLDAAYVMSRKRGGSAGDGEEAAMTLSRAIDSVKGEAENWR